MAQRVEIFDVECPAETPVASPIEVLTTFDPGTVERVEVVIPDGHAGLTGIALAVAHQPVIPFNRRATPAATFKFIEGNAETVPINASGYPDSGAWSAFLFNLDLQAHSWQLRFEINELSTAPQIVVPAPVPVGQIEGSSPPAGEAPPPAGETEGPPVIEPPDEGPGVKGKPVGGPPPADEGEEPEPPPAGEPIPPPAEGPAPAEPPELTFSLGDEEEEPEPPPGVSSAPPAGHPKAKGHPAPKGRRPPAPRTKLEVTHLTLPAGGWLPHGARFTVERTDQGQDGITEWRGPIIAPGDGQVLHNLSDRPFPDGFGPHYAVVRIDTGRFAGHDWYIGHCTSVVAPGHRFKQGAILARADQGNREGGGWFEIGEAPGGTPGPMGTGARFAHLFSPLTITHTKRVAVRVGHKKPATKGPHHAAPPKRKAAPHRPGARSPRPSTHAPAPHPGGKRRAPPAAAPKAAGPHPGARPGARPAPGRPAPAARRAPAARPPAAPRKVAPPPPPPPRRSPPPPPPKRRH